MKNDAKKDGLNQIKTAAYMHATSDGCVSSDPTAYTNARELVFRADVQQLLAQKMTSSESSNGSVSRGRVDPDEDGDVRSSFGHAVPLGQVAEWVGLNYSINFHSSGERKQEWIDRYVAGNQSDHPSYITSEGWSHIFSGQHESTTRWVYQLDTDTAGTEHEESISAMVAGQILVNGVWSDMDKAELADLRESIEDNDLPSDYDKPDWADEVSLITELPEWAQPVQQAVERPHA